MMALKEDFHGCLDFLRVIGVVVLLVLCAFTFGPFISLKAVLKSKRKKKNKI